MSEIDFGCPIEAVHIINGIVSSVEPHCRPFNKESAYSGKAGAGCVDAFYDSWRKDGTPINPNNPWHIRNVQPTPSTDRLARLEAFVARVAEGGQMLALGHYEEAKVLVAELNPVDPDEAIAKTMALDAQDDFLTPLASARLERLERHTLSAIKRGRALERGEP